MATAEEKKCAHPPCTCRVTTENGYCSAQCAAVEDTPDIDCRCTHNECEGRAH
jgi:hypothetical protein